MRPSSAQVRFLRALAVVAPADSWAEVFTHYDARGDRDDNPARSLLMRNFDRTADACRNAGWVSYREDDLGYCIDLTGTGRAVLAAARGKAT